MGVICAKQGISKIKPHMIEGTDQSSAPISVFLNSNESAFGPSGSAVAAARAAVSNIERYLEDPDQFLTPAIAAHFGVDFKRVTTGQGSDDLLARLARAYLGPDTELVRSANGYPKAPNYAYANDADVVSVADSQFVPCVDGLTNAITERTRMVYLANPENPAGTLLSGEEVRRLHAALPKHVLLVIDAAYEEYVDSKNHDPPHRLVEEADNVVMCRTFSKVFGLAGARVGWMYGPENVVDIVKRIGTTFPISSPSVAAAIAALEDVEHTRFVQRMNRKGRIWITQEMQSFGLSVVPSQGNFVLVHFPDETKSAEAVDHFLTKRGIAVRRFASRAYQDYIRITIGHRHELKAVRDGVAEFMEGAN